MNANWQYSEVWGVINADISGCKKKKKEVRAQIHVNPNAVEQKHRKGDHRLGPSADDIVLTSGNIDRAQRLLSRVENEGNYVRLLLSGKKTKVMTCNVAPGPMCILTNGGILVEEAEDFKYLGSWVNSSKRDIKAHKALAWKH